jgi:hypothetical protein
MATSIERYQPPQPKGLAIYNKTLTPLTPVLAFAKQLISERDQFAGRCFAHDERSIDHAKRERERFLAKFGRADKARVILYRATAWNRPDRNVATAMISTLLGAFGAKADAAVLAGMLNMIENDELGVASELWTPLDLSVPALALACRSLIANNIHPPRAAELHKACQDARRQLQLAESTAGELVDYVRRCDALLLDLAHDEWERPYLLPAYRPLLARMLELHAAHGIVSTNAYDPPYNEQEDHPFAKLVEAEQAKLLAAEAKPRIAACGATGPSRVIRSKPKA